MDLSRILTVADAVLYEGYLLYPYRSTSSKNQARWQFGVLGPPGAAQAGLGEAAEMHAECLLRPGPGGALTVRLRFLQLQSRLVERAQPSAPGGYVGVDEIRAGGQSFVTWDEAVEHTVELGPLTLASLNGGRHFPVEIAGGDEIQLIMPDSNKPSGTRPDMGGPDRVVRRRWPLHAVVDLDVVTAAPGVAHLSIDVVNAATVPATDHHGATAASLLGAHLVLEAHDAAFISLLDPPDELVGQAGQCQNRRCWPVLAGDEGSTDAMLVSPIILYDYPAVAAQSAGPLFDSTEIDEILTLRVMTLTDEEKAAARATDAAAAAIIDRCDAMTVQDLQQLHGILREPRAPEWAADIPVLITPGQDAVDINATFGQPWWDPGADASVSPTTDVIMIDGVAVSKGSAVRLHPSRAADAQDLFFANEPARVTGIFSDVDGGAHVAVVLDIDPAADLHEWYGRYLYFAPDEIEPLGMEAPNAACSQDLSSAAPDKEQQCENSDLPQRL